VAEWWHQNESVIPRTHAWNKPEDYPKEVEDLTGCIPLPLDKSVINGNIDDLWKIHDQVQQFMRNLGPDSFFNWIEMESSLQKKNQVVY